MTNLEKWTGLIKLWVTYFLKKKLFLIAFFFQKGVSQTILRKMHLYFANQVAIYIYMTLTSTKNKSSNQTIKKKHYLILCLDDTHYNLVNKLIKIKHYLVLFPDNTHYNQGRISRNIFPHIPETMSPQLRLKNSVKSNEAFSHKSRKYLYLLPF